MPRTINLGSPNQNGWNNTGSEEESLDDSLLDSEDDFVAQFGSMRMKEALAKKRPKPAEEADLPEKRKTPKKNRVKGLLAVGDDSVITISFFKKSPNAVVRRYYHIGGKYREHRDRLSLTRAQWLAIARSNPDMEQWLHGL